MKILAIATEKKEDILLLEHHLKSAIRDVGLINIEVVGTNEIPTDGNVANVFVMSRDLASQCNLPNILIVDNPMNYKDIKEKIQRLFTVYGILES